MNFIVENWYLILLALVAGTLLVVPSIRGGVGGGLRFNALGDVLPLYEDLNTVAVDPYIAMREAYVNFRKAQVLH